MGRQPPAAADGALRGRRTRVLIWEVDLSEAEQAVSAYVASTRDTRSIEGGYEPAFGAPPNDGDEETYVRNLTGTHGELATAKLLRLYPNFATRRYEDNGYDLDHRIGVRAARKEFGLLVRRSDPLDGRWVAAVVRGHTVKLLGWEYVALARQEQWLSNPEEREPCYLVPKRHLRSLESLAWLVALERLSQLAGARVEVRVAA